MSLRGPAATVRVAVVAACLAIVLGGCAGGTSTVAPPTAATSPAASVSIAVASTASQIQAALRTAGLSADVSPVPYRPAESPTIAAAQRLVLKANLAGDERQGFVVVYDFPDAARAYAAGTEMADYLASGPGRVQFLNDARFVLRQVGSTLVFYSWTPSDAPEPGAAAIATALGTLGLEIQIAR